MAGKAGERRGGLDCLQDGKSEVSYAREKRHREPSLRHARIHRDTDRGGQSSLSGLDFGFCEVTYPSFALAVG